jgi:tRNA threonylcarbamoyladenosine biosynthesis protein TsaB
VDPHFPPSTPIADKRIFSLPTARTVALETSARAGSLALGIGPNLIAEIHIPEAARHASALMPTLAAALAKQNWSPQSLDLLIVSIGPGSFTGLRVAIAIARALAHSVGCRLIGIDTPDVIVQNAPADAREALIVLDARRGQIFGTRYQRDAAYHWHRIDGPRLGPPESFPPPTQIPFTILGEGVSYHRPALMAAFTSWHETPEARTFPRAAALYHLGIAAAAAGQFQSPAELLPRYLRLVEAEETWRKKNHLPLTDLPPDPPAGTTSADS